MADLWIEQRALLIPLLLLILFPAVFAVLIKLRRFYRYHRSGGHSLLKVLFDKGAAGEYHLYQKLYRIPGHKVILPNIYLVRPNGNTTEIDTVMIHTSGIYIFEMKNYSGAVYGSPSSKEWTQIFGKNKKTRFYNPIFQNQIHQRAVKAALEMENDIYFHAVTVFSDACKVYIDPLPENLLSMRQIPLAVKTVIRERNGVLSPQRVKEIGDALTALNRNSREIRQRHIQNTANK